MLTEPEASARYLLFLALTDQIIRLTLREVCVHKLIRRNFSFSLLKAGKTKAKASFQHLLLYLQ